MNTGKRKAGIVPLLFALSIFASSLTAIAYLDNSVSSDLLCLAEEDAVSLYTYEKEESMEIATVLSFPYSGAVFIPDGSDQLLDLFGYHALPTKEACSHSYVTGTKYAHQKGSFGSCILRTYKAKRCKKCSESIVLAYTNCTFSEKCTHCMP